MYNNVTTITIMYIIWLNEPVNAMYLLLIYFGIDLVQYKSRLIPIFRTFLYSLRGILFEPFFQGDDADDKREPALGVN
jgi:hypothetical protein